MNFSNVLLSFDNFDEVDTLPPYLNSPRSLEACRRFGVNPIELMKIPFEEFVKNSSNNDLAEIRYEKIEGLRKKTLENIKVEWRKICNSSSSKDLIVQSRYASPTQDGNKAESIITVPKDAHSTLLEIQAAKFRKIESEEWKSFQRMLQLEIMKAENLKNSAIAEEQQKAWREDTLKAKRNQELKQLEIRKLQHEAKKREEEERIKIEKKRQADELAEELKKKVDVKDKMRLERAARESKEYERVQREEYAKKMKQTILDGIQDKIVTRKRAQELRQEEIENRLRDAREMKRKQDEIKRKIDEERLSKIKQEAFEADELKRKLLAERLAEDEIKRQQVIESNKQAMSARFSGDALRGKLMQSKAKNDELIQLKAEKVVVEHQKKQESCEQELNRIREAQEVRKKIKSVRWETFQLIAMRRKKAEEYRIKQLQNEIKAKTDRSEAIKQGYSTLTQMSGLVRVVMSRAAAEIRQEVQQSQDISSDLVIDKAMEVSNQVIYPNLKKYTDSPSADARRSLKSSSNIRKEEAFPVVLEDKRPASASSRYSRSRSALQPLPTVEVITLKSLTKTDLFQALQESKAKVLDHKKSSNRLINSEGGNSNGVWSFQKKPSPSKPLTSTGVNESNICKKSLGIQCYCNNCSQTNKRDDNDRVSSTRQASYPRKSVLNLDADQEDVELDDEMERQPNDSDNLDNLDDVFSNGDKPTAEANNIISTRSNFLPVDEKSEFRREYSADHPLASGKGKYRLEKSQGLKPVSAVGSARNGNVVNRLNRNSNLGMPNSNQLEDAEKLVITSSKSVVDPDKYIDQMRHQQGEELLAVLEHERLIEQEREEVLRRVTSVAEKRSLEQIFGEERRQASDRILELTRIHEKSLKDAMLSLSLTSQ